MKGMLVQGDSLGPLTKLEAAAPVTSKPEQSAQAVSTQGVFP